MWPFFLSSSLVYVWQLWVAFKFLVCFTHLGWFAVVMPLRKSGQWRQRAPEQSCVCDRTSCVALCSLHCRSAWPLFFHLTSSQRLMSLLSCPTRCLFSILFLLKQTNKSELTCHHKLWVILAQIFFPFSWSDPWDLFREGLLRKWLHSLKVSDQYSF